MHLQMILCSVHPAASPECAWERKKARAPGHPACRNPSTKKLQPGMSLWEGGGEAMAMLGWLGGPRCRLLPPGGWQNSGEWQRISGLEGVELQQPVGSQWDEAVGRREKGGVPAGHGRTPASWQPARHRCNFYWRGTSAPGGRSRPNGRAGGHISASLWRWSCQG